MTTRFRWKAELWSDLLSRRFLVLLFLITLTATQVLIAQTGQNAVIKDTGNHTTNSPSFFDATQFPAADPCLQIQLAFGALPATGGTVDARGLVSGSSTTLTCSVNPIPMGAKGRLLLSAGTYLAQVPWVIQNNDLNIIGTGGGGGTNTIVQACSASQASVCNSHVFPSGQGIIQLGPTAGGGAISRVTVKELGVDCQDVPGVSGVQAIAAQEETVLDLVIATGCRVAGFDIGIGDPTFLGGTGVQNGAALSNFEVGYPSNGSGGGQGCPQPINPGSISTISRNATTGVVSVTLSAPPVPGLADGYEVVVSGVPTASFNGTYRVNSGSTSTSFSYNQPATLGAQSDTSGIIALYPVGVRVWQVSSSAVRPIINGTINGSNCASFPPIAMELSGGSPFVHNVHTEGFGVGVQVGDLSGTNGATLTNLKLNHNTTTGIVISNQWATAGGAPGALPTENINIFNLDVTGGPGTQTAQSIIDNRNGNTLTNAAGNGTVGYYLYGLNGVMTSAKPESGLVNAFDINNQTTAIYSANSTAAFSAGPTAVTIGTSSNLSGLSINGGTSLTGQTGTGGSIALSVSPALTGNPTAPTQASTDNSTRIATTAFVQSHLPQVAGSVSRLSQNSNISGTLIASPSTGTYMLSLCLWVQSAASGSGTVLASVSYNNGTIATSDSSGTVPFSTTSNRSCTVISEHISSSGGVSYSTTVSGTAGTYGLELVETRVQ